ncbi:MAG: threonine synthase [Myxococcales bacterium]|nr:threonine synthase [Myxococcales bacterium]MBK7193143.1 threonine synthase [Myxococcales bacterium]
MTFSAWFQCIAGCAGRWSLTEIRYRCPTCGELLEVAHDLDALRAARDGAGWRALFDARWRGPAFPDASGVWGKREVVAPHVRPEHIVTAAEGGSALLPVPGYARALGLGDLRIKQCGVSHTGSFKDLGMTVLVSTVKQMIADGASIRAIACASTGDTSAALAAYGAAAGVPTVVILPAGKISTAQLVQPLANGALVLALDTDFDGCMAIVQELADKEGVYLANSMNSLRLEGQKTVAMEIAQQLGWELPDWVIIPGGNLGNVSALEAGFRTMIELGMIDRAPRICVAQAANASPLYQAYRRGFAAFAPVPAQTTLASAIQIGNPVSWKKAVRALERTDGVVAAASEAELADAAGRADRYGLFTCPHTGVALAALEQLTAAGTIAAGSRVVVVSTASGLKFADFKIGYHEARLAAAPAPRWRNQPVAVAARYADVRDALWRGLDATA